MTRYRVQGHYGRTMATDCRVHPRTQGAAKPIRPPRRSRRAQRHPVDPSHRGSVERSAPAISATQHVPSTIPAMDSIGRVRQDSLGLAEDLRDRCGIEIIAPRRRDRRKPATRDGRPFRRYKRRWKVERPVSLASELSGNE